MANFATKAQEIPSAGIGQQQIVQGQTASTLQGLDKAVGIAASGLSTLGQIAGKKQAESIVNQSAQQALAINKSDVAKYDSFAQQSPETAGKTDSNFIDSYNQFKKQNPELEISKQDFETLRTAKGQGKLTGTAVEMFAAAKAREAIRRNPFLANPIRQAASNLLGFNVETAGAKFIIDQLNTQAHQRSSGATYIDKINEKAVGIATYTGGDPKDIAKDLVEHDAAISRKEALDAKLAVQGYATERDIVNQTQVDRTSRLNDIKHRLQAWQTQNPGQKITIEDIQQQINLDKTSYLDNLLSDYENKNMLTNDLAEVARKRTDEIYKDVQDYFTLGDPVARTQALVKGMNVSAEYLAATHFQPWFVMSKVNEGFANKVLDIMNSSRSPEQFQALLKEFPALKSLGDINDVKAFTFDAINYWRDPTSALPATQEDMKDAKKSEGAQTYWGAHRGELPEEGKDALTDFLRKEGKNIRATDILSKNEGNATDKERGYYLSQFKATKTTAPYVISEGLFNSNGFELQFSREKDQFVLAPQPGIAAKMSEEQATAISDQMQKLNIHYKGLKNGWDKDAKTSPEIFVRDTISAIDSNMKAKMEDINKIFGDPQFQKDWTDLQQRLNSPIDTQSIYPETQSIGDKTIEKAVNALSPIQPLVRPLTIANTLYQTEQKAEIRKQLFDEFLKKYPQLGVDGFNLYKRLTGAK